MSRPIYEVHQTGRAGVLVDIFPIILASVPEHVLRTVVWTIFDLTWSQHKDGLLQHAMLEKRSRERNSGLRLDAHGLYFLLSQAHQIVDGLFIGDKQFRSWVSGEEPEDLLRTSELGLRVFDSSFWQVSSSINSINELIAATFGPTILG